MLERGREILHDNFYAISVIFHIFASLNTFYILGNKGGREPTSTAFGLMSWYFTAGLHFQPFPLITQQISNYYVLFQTCMPNWWWHFIQMIEVREKVIQKSDDWQPLTFLSCPPMAFPLPPPCGTTVFGSVYT